MEESDGNVEKLKTPPITREQLLAAPFMQRFIKDAAGKREAHRLLRRRSKVYRRFANLNGNGTSVVLEGGIGAGKSTLGPEMTQLLRDAGLRSHFFPERINRRLLHGAYLKNVPRNAMLFQWDAMGNRISVDKEAEVLSNSGASTVVDRGFIGDLSFMIMQRFLGYVDDDQFDVYCDLLKDAERFEPSILVVLDCSSENCVKRVATRDEQCEQVYDWQYFENLRICLEVALELFYFGPKLILDWNEDLTVSGGGVCLTRSKLESIWEAIMKAIDEFNQAELERDDEA